MKTNPNNSKSARQMKIAEAAVLFVLILGLTIFVGVRFAPKNDISEIGSETIVSEVIADTEEAVPAIVEMQEASSEIAEAVIEEPTALEVEPPRVVTYASAEKAYFDGNYADSALQFAEYTKGHSANAWGFYMLGLAEMKAGDDEGSEIAFQAALNIKPDHVKSLVNYGRLLLALDRAEEARTQVELALITDPGNTSANRVLGRIYHNLQELESAKAAYKTVLLTNPDDAWSLNNLGLICIEQGDFEDAIAPLAKASGLKSDEACFHNNLGVALEKIGQYEAAAEAYDSALVADSNYAKALVSLARVETLDEADGTVGIDLIALAASFTVTEAIAVEIQEGESSDMEVATAITSPEVEVQ